MIRGRYFDRYSCEFDFIPNVLSSLYMNGDIDDYVMTHPIEWKKYCLKKDFAMTLEFEISLLKK